MRVDGRPVSVAGVHPGEVVSLRLRRRREAELIEVLEASPARVVPACRHFAACGGCADQHVPYQAQVAAKERTLLRVLAEAGAVPERVLPAVSGSPWRYRRRARLGVRYVPAKGGALVGFRERVGNRVTDMVRCEVLAAPADRLVAGLRDLVSRLVLAGAVPQIEVAVGENGVALVFRHLAPLPPADLHALAAFAEASGTWVYLQPAGPDSVAPFRPAPAPMLEYRLPAHDVVIGFRPTDFVQVNAEVNRGIVDLVVDYLAPRPGERVVDLFCGLGNFTLPLARRGAAVLGVEGAGPLLERARANAERNRLETARFEAADLGCPGAVRDALAWRPDKLLLDPPRSGAHVALGCLGPHYPTRIAYVSCNPATFARDAADLVGRHGYRLAAAGIADMFPHTRHLEAIGLLARGD